MPFLYNLTIAMYELFLDAGVYVLLGFVFAGVLNYFFPTKRLLAMLGTGRFSSIIRAAIFGVPLPLCSCSVLPTALTLKKKGASKGAAASFLISTPESGVDSILLTYGLLDGIMAVTRPVVALIDAIVSGVAVELWDHKDDPKIAPVTAEALPTCDDGCGSSHNAAGHAHDHEHVHDHHDHSHDHDHSHEEHSHGETGSWWDRSIGFAFGDLLDEMSHWLLFGLVLSGFLAALVPETFIANYLGAGLIPKLVMLIVGIPIYICASASTPLVASLIMKGMSPGTALVFLIAGPATNLGTMAVLAKFFGKRFVALYLSTTAIVAVVAGFTIDAIYTGFGIDAKANIGQTADIFPYWLQVGGAVVLIALLLRSIWKLPLPAEFRAMQGWFRTLTGILLTKRLVARGTAAAVVLVWLTTAVSAVPLGSVGFRKQLGVAQETPLERGWHAHLPWPFGQVDLVPIKQVQRVEIGFRSQVGDVRTLVPSDVEPLVENIEFLPLNESKIAEEAAYLTGDENMLDITASVHYRIADPYVYRYSWAEGDVDETVRSLAMSRLIRAIASETIDKVYTVDRTPVEHRMLAAMQEAVKTYGLGIEIIDVALLDVHAPAEVHPKFRDVASAMEDKQRYINESRVYAEEILTRVGGETHRIVNLAEADKEAAILAAKGSVSGFLAQLEGYSIAPEAFRYRRYTETIEDVLSGNRKIIRPSDAKGIQLDFWRFGGKPTTSAFPPRTTTSSEEASSPMSIEEFLKQRRQAR